MICEVLDIFPGDEGEWAFVWDTKTTSKQLIRLSAQDDVSIGDLVRVVVEDNNLIRLMPLLEEKSEKVRA